MASMTFSLITLRVHSTFLGEQRGAEDTDRLAERIGELDTLDSIFNPNSERGP